MIAALLATATSAPAADPHREMLAEIRAAADEDYPGWSAEQDFRAAIDAIAHLDRSAFVPTTERAHADRIVPLPIGFDQTISSPYVVAVMTAALGVRPGSRVLEIGTGSGYQAAVLSRLGADVRSIEIVPELAEAARKRLRRLGIANVAIRTGDGSIGWRDAAPYDAIVVTAGASEIPPPLLDQLKPGGRLIMPVGRNALVHQLIVVAKARDGSLARCSLGPAMFVPLTGAGERQAVPAPYDRSVPLCRKGQTARWPGQAIGEGVPQLLFPR